MAAEFRITIAGSDYPYARDAARAAFAELDRLEGLLSRFHPTSDVARINSLPTGGSVRVSPDTFRCLSEAFRVGVLTGGAFDITAGANGTRRGRLVSSRTGLKVRAVRAGARIDLGGIGKGYALDRMAVLLREWGMDRAMLSGGGSTVLALDPEPGKPGWTVGIRHPGRRDRELGRVVLCRASFSGSGTAENGAHILDPATGLPARGPAAAWVLAPSGAESDALSTAFMVMKPARVKKLVARRKDASAIIAVSASGGFRLQRIGPKRAAGFTISLRDKKRARRPSKAPGRR
jgi:thiamine biosynthesis lipoprotein